MRKSNGLLGLIGIIFLVFAGVGYAITRAGGLIDQIYIIAHAALGLLALIAYLSSGLENLKDFLSERSTKYGTSTIVGSLLFLGILVAANYISARHGKRFDLTEQNIYSLSPQSENVIKNLAQDLKLYAFVEGGVSPQLKDLFESYQYISPKVSFQIVDPDRDPQLAEKYKVAAFNSVVLEYGEATNTVTQPSEETITNAVIKVTRKSQETVCFVEGHGEPSTEDEEDPAGLSAVKEALTGETYQVKSILLATMEKVPDDCSVVVAIGTDKPYLESETKALDQFLKAGKRALFFVPARKASELRDFLGNWGVRLGDDVVVDEVVRLFQGPSLGVQPVVETYDPSHEITREMKKQQPTRFPMTRSVVKGPETKGFTVTELAKTSPTSWAETDVDGVFVDGRAEKGPTDRPGPVAVAAAVEADLKELGVEAGGNARLVVFGSSEFAQNRNVNRTFNRDLMLNSVAWLVGQSDLVSLRPKTMRSSRAELTPAQFSAIFYLSVLIIPELLLVVGIAVWWRRE